MTTYRIKNTNTLFIIIVLPYIYLIVHLWSSFTQERNCVTVVYRSEKSPNRDKIALSLEYPEWLLKYFNSESENLSYPTLVPEKHLQCNEIKITIFVITPTYTRPSQLPDMTRLAQTLRLVPNIFWIISEDSHNKSHFVADLLVRTNIPHVHLFGHSPHSYGARGVANRLKALEWVRRNYLHTQQKSVIYFADDDNSYDVRVFEEMRSTNTVSMFPVGGIKGYGMSAPIVNSSSGQIIGFHDAFGKGRKFGVDMAGFAVNLQYFLSRTNVTMLFENQEDSFLQSLGVQLWELEPKAHNCTQLLVWHTQTVSLHWFNLAYAVNVQNVNQTNIAKLYQNVLKMVPLPDL